MKADELEIFKPGDRVWTKLLEGEYASYSLLMRHGIGTGPFSIRMTMEADSGTYQGGLHPQLLLLVDDQDEPVNVHGREGALSAFWFTTKDMSGVFEQEYTTAEQEELSGFIERALYALRDLLKEANKLQEVVDTAEQKGYLLGFTLFTQVTRAPKESSRSLGPLAFTPQDEEEFPGLFGSGPGAG